jgi:probable phosphoglycerate mutase
MKLPPIFLLRHGQTEWNALGRYQGQMNSDLTLKGEAQAAAQGRLLGAVFTEFPDIHICSSPLGRSRQTAQIALAGYGREVVFQDELKEIAAGEWEGVTKNDIEAGWPDLFNAYQTSFELFMFAPNGEGYEALHDRCTRFLISLNSPCVVFSHGVTIAVLRSIIRNLSFKEMIQLDNQQGCIYKIEDEQETLISVG